MDAALPLLNNCVGDTEVNRTEARNRSQSGIPAFSFLARVAKVSDIADVSCIALWLLLYVFKETILLLCRGRVETFRRHRADGDLPIAFARDVTRVSVS